MIMVKFKQIKVTELRLPALFLQELESPVYLKAIGLLSYFVFYGNIKRPPVVVIVIIIQLLFIRFDQVF